MPKNKPLCDVWTTFNTFPRLIRCYRKAAKGKYDRLSILRFYSNMEAYCFEIQNQLETGTYHWSHYREFTVHDPKKRVIQSASFRDRVVHQAIHEILEPIFDRVFYHHSYACRPGRGTHGAVRQLRKFFKVHPEFHYLKMDVTKFFPSIDREVLFKLIAMKVDDDKFMSLVKTLLFDAPGTTGLPIGNLTSQLLANVYLNHLDQFVKRKLGVKFYIRYMDDIVLLSNNKSDLIEWRKAIEDFGWTELRLKFRPQKVVFGRVKEGITFIGYRIFPWGLLIKGRSLRRFRRKMREPLDLDKKIQRFLSYQGHLKHVYKSEELIQKLSESSFSMEEVLM